MDQNSTSPGTLRRLVAWLVTPALLVALAAGCSDDGDKVTAGPGDSSSTTVTTARTTTSVAPSTTSASSATTTRAGATTSPTTGSTTTAGTTSLADDPRVTTARQDLQRRFGYDPADIKVVSVESVTWPTTALGCPVTGKMYAQTLVEGYRIVLAWKTTNFKYHGANGEVPFLCEFLD